jgi:hypothetical protein
MRERRTPGPEVRGGLEVRDAEDRPSPSRHRHRRDWPPAPGDGIGRGGPALAATERSQEFLESARQQVQRGDVPGGDHPAAQRGPGRPRQSRGTPSLGELYLRTGQYDSAERELSRAHAGRPSDATELMLGQALLALGRSEEVLKVVQGHRRRC